MGGISIRVRGNGPTYPGVCIGVRRPTALVDPGRVG